MNTNSMPNKTNLRKWIVAVSIVIPITVAALFGIKVEGVDFSFLPPIYATINGITAVLIILALAINKNCKVTMPILINAYNNIETEFNKLNRYRVPLQPTDIQGLKALEKMAGLLQQAGEWERFVSTTTDENLQREFYYKNIKGDSFRSAVWQVLHHLFNHGTYHRGQLVTMMRELGVTAIPATDFIHWYRTRV